jgi:hypothetical protein
MKYVSGNKGSYLVFDTGKKIRLTKKEKEEYENKIKEYILIGKTKERGF